MILHTLNILNKSPLEQFEVTNLLSIQFPIFGYFTLTLTNLALYSIIVLLLTLALHITFNNESRLIPSKASIVLETIYATVHGIVKDQMGQNNERYFPFIYSLFIFILIANLTGNISYNYTITTSIIVSMGLSVTIFIGVTILALVNKKLDFFGDFVPTGTPPVLTPLLSLIELVSYSARAFSLGIRLFANMVAGHTLLNILSTFLLQFFKNENLFIVLGALLPFSIFCGLSVLEVAVSFIQAYVFTLLTSSYIKEALSSH